MIVGAALPLTLFAIHFAAHGFGFTTLLKESFATPAASAFVTDLLLSATIGLMVMARDARQRGVQRFGIVILATCLAGLSFSLPLYLYLRESQ
jgi:hypothetical protein